MPHLFFLRADRQVHRYGVIVLAFAAAVLLVVSGGDTQRLVPLFAIGVFVGFTLSQAGMVRHWRASREQGWAGRAMINGIGAVFTLAALAVELISKFTEGAWLIVLIVPLLVLMFARVHATYQRIGSVLQIGTLPPPPVQRSALVVVPVGGISRLTQEGISAALSLGDEVVAITVSYADEDSQDDDHGQAAADPGDSLTGLWQRWNPGVPLVTLPARHRSLGPPIVRYLRELEAQDKFHRIVVLIPEVPAGQAVAADPAQPARLRARPRHPQGHRQRGDLPPAVPAFHLVLAADGLHGGRGAGHAGGRGPARQIRSGSHRPFPRGMRGISLHLQ